MTGGWIYSIRLFSDMEAPEWDEELAKIKTEKDGKVVGAQWNVTKVLHEPPLRFEEGVTYRPVFKRNPKEVHK